MVSQLVDRDSEHLRILSIFEYAAAAVTALVGSFPLFHVAIGALFLLMPDSMRGTGRDQIPREVGFVFMGLGLAFVIAGWSMALAQIFTARFLRQRRHFWFCVAVSALSCIACMFSRGIVGVAALVILLRPGVKDLFGPGSAGVVAEP